MLENHLRPTIESLIFEPIVRILEKSGAHPNHVTLASLCFGLAVVPALYLGTPWLAVGLLWLSGLGDVIDGSLARATEKTSDFGTAFDIISDRIVEFSVVLALFLVSPGRELVALSMLGSILVCVTSFLVVGIMTEKKGPKSFYYSPGLMERAEAFVMFSLMMLLPGWFTLLGWLFVGLVSATAIIRVNEFRRAQLS